MPNMSHCRFENTSGDLADCLEHMDDNLAHNDYEMSGRRRLVELCKEIADKYEANEWDDQEEESEEEDEE